MPQMNRIPLACTLLVGLALLALPLAAEETREQDNPRTSGRETAARDAEPLGDLVVVQGARYRMTSKLQLMLESPQPGHTRLPNGLTLGEVDIDPGVVGYTCTDNGTCTCNGAFDCVQMIAADGVCEAGTVGCNDDICVCNEGGTQCPFDECSGGG